MFFDSISLVYAWFVANWSSIEGLARNIALDIAAVIALAKGLAVVLKALPWNPFKKAGAIVDAKVMGVFGK